MKKSLLVIIGVLAVVTLGLFIWNPMASAPGIFALANVVPAAAVTFKKDASGNIVMSEDEFKSALAMQSDLTIEAFREKFGLDVVPKAPPGMSGTPAPVEKSWDAPIGETKSAQMKRILDAVTEIKGGTLAVAKAPKEVKTVHYLRALYNNDVEKVKELGPGSWGAKALSEGSATDGGNLVPIEYATDLIVALENYQIVNDVTMHRMASNKLDLHTITTKPIVYQVGEKTAATEAGTKTDAPEIVAKAFSGIQVITNELWDDNNIANFYQKQVDLFAEQFNQRISYEVMIGQTFTGVFKSVAPVTTTLDSVSIKDITYKKLVSMANSLSAGRLGGNAKWYMHRNIFAYILGIVDDNGRPIIQNPWDPMNRSLLGYPVVLDEAISNNVSTTSEGLVVSDPTDAANTAYIAFGNLKWVDFGMRQDVRAQIGTEGTVAGVNLLEQRSKALVIDTRWGLVVSQPTYLAILKSKAA